MQIAAVTEWSQLLLCDIIYIPFCHCRGWVGAHRGFFVPGDLDLWPWHSNLYQRGTKHFFPTNLVQIHSAIPQIFDSQRKKNKKATALKTEPYAVHYTCGK